MWKPGQIVTIDGIVYRVKRNNDNKGPCEKCALDRGRFCAWKDFKKYPLPGYGYLVRLSPVTATWGFGQLITTPTGKIYRVAKGTCEDCDISITSPFCIVVCKHKPGTCLKRENYVESGSDCNN